MQRRVRIQREIGAGHASPVTRPSAHTAGPVAGVKSEDTCSPSRGAVELMHCGGVEAVDAGAGEDFALKGTEGIVSGWRGWPHKLPCLSRLRKVIANCCCENSRVVVKSRTLGKKLCKLRQPEICSSGCRRA